MELEEPSGPPMKGVSVPSSLRMQSVKCLISHEGFLSALIGKMLSKELSVDSYQ